MTQFALTRSWPGASRRVLVVSEVEGGHVVALPTVDPSSPVVVWVADVAACVVLGAPSTPGPLGVRGLHSAHGVFEPMLPDGTALGRAPVVADLTTGGPATLALVLDPPQRVTVSPDGFRRAQMADVVLCSPEEPDAVGRALAALGVALDTDVHAVAVRHFGQTSMATAPRTFRRPNRWFHWVMVPCIFFAVVAGQSSAPRLAWIPAVVFVAAIVADTIGGRRRRGLNLLRGPAGRR